MFNKGVDAGPYHFQLKGRVEVMNLELVKDFYVYNRQECAAAGLTLTQPVSNLNYFIGSGSHQY